MLKMSTTMDVVKPADNVSSMVNLRAMATAAIAYHHQHFSGSGFMQFTFMGCTGNGIPKNTPVNTFHRPEKTRVVDKDMELLTARVIIKGRRVPRSPSDPDISSKGELRRVATLFA